MATRKHPPALVSAHGLPAVMLLAQLVETLQEAGIADLRSEIRRRAHELERTLRGFEPTPLMNEDDLAIQIPLVQTFQYLLDQQ